MSGRVGRPSVPGKVHYLNGNPSKKPLAALLDEFSPDVELPDVPTWVRDEARREYKRIGEQLERYGLISHVDRNALVILACTWGRVVLLEKLIAEKNSEAPGTQAGMFMTTATGYRAMTPEYTSLHREQANYFKYCAEFGLTPAARSKVKPGDPQTGFGGAGFEKPDAASGPTFGNYA